MKKIHNASSAMQYSTKRIDNHEFMIRRRFCTSRFHWDYTYVTCSVVAV